MRKTLFLFLCVLVGFSAFSKTADSRDIELRARQSDQEALRSVLPVRAWQEENTIWVEFFNSPESATITVKKSGGNEVFSKTFSSPELIQLPLTQLSGEYVVEITYGDIILSGEFIIE